MTPSDRFGVAGHWFMPTTRWTFVNQVSDGDTQARDGALEALCKMYWHPVFCYIRRKGTNEEKAKDLTQGFFAKWLEKDLFGKADRKRGRFRNFMLKSLENYLHNEHRKSNAGIRKPAGGFVDIDQWMTEWGDAYVPRDEETPEQIFDRQWAMGLLLRVLRSLKEECEREGAKLSPVHFEVFCLCVIAPILEGTEAPRRAELASQYGLTAKQVSNLLTPARRAYQRLLRAEIRLYAADDDEVEQEIKDIMQFLSGLM